MSVSLVVTLDLIIIQQHHVLLFQAHLRMERNLTALEIEGSRLNSQSELVRLLKVYSGLDQHSYKLRIK